MLDVYYIKQGQDLHLIEAVGHADYAEQGKDIVCAAASILAYTLEMSLKTLPEQHVRVTTQLADGYARYLIKVHDQAPETVTSSLDAMLGMALTGYSILAGQYEGHVCVHL